MGRRSTSSTNSGKFMNPTDQVRKESQKRELKNKKQSMTVRAAVAAFLKMKDPKQITRDMEKLDEMEFNPLQQPQLNEKVLKNKRKKLKSRYLQGLEKLEVEYEQKRAQLRQYFDAVENVMVMMFLAPVKMMALLRTRTNISMVTILMMVTPTDQMEKTAMKKTTQV
uniref:Wbp11/ELF5/Saf1 N-terminal domain-containing protein n=1 Tax=Pan troglodytes TaxID=9598 RepID=A0A2I3SXP0_PANTR